MVTLRVCAYTLPTPCACARHVLCYVRAIRACVCVLLCVHVPCVRVCTVLCAPMCHVCVCAMRACEPCMYIFRIRYMYFNTKKKQQKIKKNSKRRRHYHLMLKLHLHHGLLHIIPASANGVSSSLRKLQIKSNSPLCRRQSGTGFPLLLWHETIAATSGSHVELIVIVR